MVANRLNLSFVIWRKEIREILLDRRTLFAAVISPLFITPMLILLSGFFIQNQTKKQEQAVYKVGIVNQAVSPEITQFIKANPTLTIVMGSRPELEKEVVSHSVKAVIILPDNINQALKSNKTASIDILYDPGNDVSSAAAGRIQWIFGKYADKIEAQRLKSANLPSDFMKPFNINEVATKGTGTTTMYLLAMFIPYVLALSAFSGGMTSATDQIAGEKERGTLETLLVSPASRRQIVTGKFCAVACVCLTSGLLSVVGLIIPLSLHAGGYLFGGANLGGLSFSVGSALLIALAQIPLALLFSGLLVAISSFSRNPKEASTYQGPLIMLILIPAMGTMFASTDQPISTAFIPIFNSTLMIKQVLAGVHDPSFIMAAILSSIIYAAVGIVIATLIFDNEKILLKT